MELKMAKKPSPLSLLLKNSNQVNSQNLTPAKNVISPNKLEFLFKKPQTTAERISMLGFKNPNDLAEFLRTPAGKALEKSIYDLIMQDISIMNENRQNQLDKQIRRDRIIASLYLYRLRKEFNREQFYRRDTERQLKSIAQRQQAEQKIQAQTSLKHDKPQKNLISIDYPRANDIYKASQLLLEDEIELNLIELEQFEMELAALQFEENLFILQNQINKAYEHSSLLDNLSADEKLKTIDDLLGQLIGKIAKHEQAIITELTPDAAIEESHSPKLVGLQARKQILEEIKAQLLGKKSFYDEAGEITSSHEKAQFILDEDIKLVKHEGKIYLLSKTDDFESLSQAQKAEAQKKFELEKPRLNNVNQVIKNNHPVNINLHQEKAETLASRCEEKLKTLLNLYNQLTTVNSLLSTKESEDLQSLTETTPVPRPSPKSSTQPQTDDLDLRTAKKALTLLRMTPNEKMVKLFIDSFSYVKGKFEPNLNQTLSNTIQPGRPLSFMQMQGLLKIMESFGGVSAYKGNVTSTPRPAPDYTPPSPFSTRLKPPGTI